MWSAADSTVRHAKRWRNRETIGRRQVPLGTFASPFAAVGLPGRGRDAPLAREDRDGSVAQTDRGGSQFQTDPSNSGYAPDECVPTSGLRKKWEVDGPDRTAMYLSAARDNLFVGRANHGAMDALDPETGEKRWSWYPGDDVDKVATSEDVVVAVSEDGDVRGRIRAPDPSGAPESGGIGFYAPRHRRGLGLRLCQDRGVPSANGRRANGARCRLGPGYDQRNRPDPIGRSFVDC
jgi:hypothetical protein